MDPLLGAASPSGAEGIIKDTTGAQIISGTLDKMNTGLTATGPKMDADYQFRKDVLAAAGVGRGLDITA